MPPCTIFFDVDNTLIDNDRAKAALRARLLARLGETETDRFWATYEAVRVDRRMVDIPRTLARFQAARPPLAPVVSDTELASAFTTLPYAAFLFPTTLPTLAALGAAGHQLVILSDGDPVFQPHKIWRAGLADAVAGAVIVVPDKTRELGAATAYYPAAQTVIVDDKPTVLEAATARLAPPPITVHIARGHYGDRVDPARLARFDLRLADIGELPAALPGALATRLTMSQPALSEPPPE